MERRAHNQNVCLKQAIRCGKCGGDYVLRYEQRHVNYQCPYSKVKCTLCSGVYPRNKEKEHLKKCPKRRQSCPLCGIPVYAEHMSQHLDGPNFAQEHYTALQKLQKGQSKVLTTLAERVGTTSTANLQALLQSFSLPLNPGGNGQHLVSKVEGLDVGPVVAYFIGRMFEYGLSGVEQDATKALEWYSKAMTKNYDMAFIQVALMHLDGPDPQKALPLLRRASISSVLGKTLLGKCLLTGEARSVKEGIQLLESAGQFPMALFLLGEKLHSCGNAAQKARGLRLVEKSARCGYADAQAFLGHQCYREEKYERAYKYLKFAMDQGHARASTTVGCIHFFGRGRRINLKSAFACFEQGHKFGDESSTYNLAHMFEHGKGLARPDFERAVDLYMRAAHRGHLLSTKWVAKYYLDGDRVQKDPCEAVLWYAKAHEVERSELSAMDLARAYDATNKLTKSLELWSEAAEHKNEQALFEVAERHFYGQGVSEDKAGSIEYYKEAAERGHVKAQLQLGRFYKEGVVVDRNVQLASHWLNLAAGQNNKVAAELLYALTEQGSQ